MVLIEGEVQRRDDGDAKRVGGEPAKKVMQRRLGELPVLGERGCERCDQGRNQDSAAQEDHELLSLGQVRPGGNNRIQQHCSQDRLEHVAAAEIGADGESVMQTDVEEEINRAGDGEVSRPMTLWAAQQDSHQETVARPEDGDPANGPAALIQEA